jgi:hypothetical protein
MRRLLGQVDEWRNLRTNATVDQLLDRHFELAELGVNSRALPQSGGETHPATDRLGKNGSTRRRSVRLLLRHTPALPGPLGQRQRIDHRTDGPHQCDNRCEAHLCRPPSNGSIRYIHFILSGALRAVRWPWIATNPIAQAVPPPQPKPNPQPPTAEQAARILREAWQDPDWAMLIWLTTERSWRAMLDLFDEAFG